MKPSKKILTKTLEEIELDCYEDIYDTWEDKFNAKSFIEFLQGRIKQYSDYHDISFDIYIDDDDNIFDMKLYGKRKETDAEYHTRLEREEASLAKEAKQKEKLAIEQERVDYLNFKRLKVKYGW